MTFKELANMIGREYMLDMEGLAVLVSVDDVKTAYGNARALVQPIAGANSKWVNADRLQATTP